MIQGRYDVPLQKANQNGYYNEMVKLVSQIFGYSMKSNPYMEFAVVTGCLRIAKESIFTGFNNPKIHSITDEQYDEWFGFTDSEVRKMLAYYGQEKVFDLTKEWYDGYLFGNVHVYCPWDVINWCDQLVNTSDRLPKNFWANTSGNDMIRRFADKADSRTREQIEALIKGEGIKKKVSFELTYNEIDSNMENLWSVMFMTGYLTQRSHDGERYRELVIPNREIRTIIQEQVEQWFAEKVLSDQDGLGQFCEAFVTGDTDIIGRYMNAQLSRLISVRDTQARKGRKENFYHGLILGMLGSRDDFWEVESNTESGDGYSDIRVSRFEDNYAFIIEVKYADSERELRKSAREALKQINEQQYARYFTDRGFANVKCYGIAFYKKQCAVFMNG